MADDRFHGHSRPPARGGRKRGTSTQALGRSRGGFSTKIHLITDSHGNPVDYVLTPGQVNDATQAETLLLGRQGQYVLADKGYDSDAIVACIEHMGAEAVIPPKSNRVIQRPYDRHLYKARHAIENAFAKLKRSRSLATRYDKTQRNYAAMVAIACSLTWLRL